MSEQNKRRSDRTIPFVSDNEMVVIHQDGQASILAKMMDLSELGTLVYQLSERSAAGAVELSIYNDGRICQVPACVIRKNGRLVAMEFVNLTPETLREIQSKLIRMEAEWMRLGDRT